jgi:hypothetical protein
MEDYLDFLTASDLVKMGIFPSTSAVGAAKFIGLAPPSIKFSERKVRYPKDELIKWLEERRKK